MMLIYILILTLLMGQGLSATDDPKFVLSSPSLPTDQRLFPAVGNGYIATQVYQDTIYMNGVYNGRGPKSHRARIPSSASISIEDDMEFRDNKYSLNMKTGCFERTFSYKSAHVKQDIFAHRVRPNIIVNIFRITRGGASGEITLRLRGNMGNASEDINMNSTVVDDIKYAWGTINETETENSTEVEVHQYWTPLPDSLTLLATTYESVWLFLTSLGKTQEEARSAYFDAINDTNLYQSHVESWRNLWEETGISISDNTDLASTINACFFHILISLPPDDDHEQRPFFGLSPGGLARGGWIRKDKIGGAYNDYTGHVFWDMDTWIMPPIMLFRPNLARLMLKSRIKVRDNIRIRAQNSVCPRGPCHGVRFPWEQAFTGFETCPWEPASLYQVHVTADVAYAIRQYIYATNDVTFLRDKKGKELAMDIARYWKSRTQENKEKNRYEIYGVMGPDEYHFNINNSVFTNYNAKLSLTLPTYLQKFVNRSFTEAERQECREFEAVAEKLVIPFDPVNSFHPQFDGFLEELETRKENFSIKQSDVVLLGYPLMCPMSRTTRRNDLELYEQVTDRTGPDTGTWSMHTVGWLELGNYTKANHMFATMFRNINGPFKIFSEKPAFAADGMRATNFITGMGGMLQAVVFGYAGLRLRMHQLDLLPVPLPNATWWSLKGVHYRDSILTIEVGKDTVNVILTRQTADENNRLRLITQTDRRVYQLRVNQPVTIKNELASLVTKKEENLVEYQIPLTTTQAPTSTSTCTAVLPI